MANIIVAGFLGFLLGALIMAVCLMKDVDRIWDSAFEAGEQYGAESEKEQLPYYKLVVDSKTGEAYWEVTGDAN